MRKLVFSIVSACVLMSIAVSCEKESADNEVYANRYQDSGKDEEPIRNADASDKDEEPDRDGKN